MTVFAGIQLPKVIYTTHSQYNNTIEVIQKGNLLMLSVDGVLQSVSWNSESAKKRVWGRMVQLIQEESPNFKNIMILGLGGGTLQHLLNKDFPNMQNMTSVEIDKEIVNVAQYYFKVHEIPNHHILTADALHVVTEPVHYNILPQFFDVLVVDIFNGEEYPDLANSGTFIGSLKNMVVPGGLLIFNRVYLEHHQYDVNAFIETLEPHFGDVRSIICAGKTNSDNVLIYARTH